MHVHSGKPLALTGIRVDVPCLPGLARGQGRGLRLIQRLIVVFKAVQVFGPTLQLARRFARDFRAAACSRLDLQSGQLGPRRRTNSGPFGRYRTALCAQQRDARRTCNTVHERSSEGVHVKT
jgi:hypothetical protein